jgi:hypothetical protein
MVRTRALALSIALIGAACAHADVAAPRAVGDASSAADDAAIVEGFKHAYDSSELPAYQKAKGDHAAWLAQNASSPNAREARTRYAKLLFALGEYRSAADEFAKVADLASGRAPDYVARGVLRNRVLALVHWVKEGDRPVEPLRHLKDRGRADKIALAFSIESVTVPDFTQSAPPAEGPVPQPEQLLAQACDDYREIAEGDDGALPTITLISAAIYFTHGHIKEGAERCGDIVTRWPHTDIATMCVRATTGGFNARHDWNALEKHARALRNNLSLIGSDHDLERYLVRLVEVATFNRIQSEAEGKSKSPDAQRQRLIAGAEAFRAYQREFPYSENADKALYNAFVYFVRVAKKDDALAMGNQLVAQYGSSELVPQVRRGMKQLEH